MNQDALRDLITNISEAKTFVLSQAPDIAKQIIAWQVYGGLLATLPFIAVLILCIWCWRRHFSALEKTEERAMYWALMSLLMIIPAIRAGAGVSAAAHAIVAPKLVIIEQLSQMVK